MRLPLEFYKQPAVQLAPLLLGKMLCRKIGDDIMRLAITETEAYAGESDTACHARRGKTPRTAVMYEVGGIAYVYLCYGIHHLLNVVAADAEQPEAVLIRGLDGISGPGRLTKALQIDMAFNREDFINSDRLWLEDGPQMPYTTTPRIGIDYASEEDKARLWRFIATKDICDKNI
ncbi:MAG: DNA-3-methyladenine glycosylase [Defluviitaleaceae bacterium]|nr:DNA-3-methyladenine glycosylase [Defluviitaleaceae bacterium]